MKYKVIGRDDEVHGVFNDEKEAQNKSLELNISRTRVLVEKVVNENA